LLGWHRSGQKKRTARCMSRPSKFAGQTRYARTPPRQALSVFSDPCPVHDQAGPPKHDELDRTIVLRLPFFDRAFLFCIARPQRRSEGTK
jgi:hypothetical protein